MSQPAPDFTHAHHPFKPQSTGGQDAQDPSVTIAGFTALQVTAALPTRTAGNNYVQVANLSTGWAYVNFGDASVAAATVAASMPIPPASTRIFGLEPWQTNASVIQGTANGNVIFTAGQGIS